MKIKFDKIKDSENIQATLERLYRTYLNDIQRFVRGRVENVPAQEDIISDVFLDLIAYVQSGKEVRNVRAFLYKIARNTIIDYYKDKARISTHEHADAEIYLETQLTTETGADERIDRGIDLQMVHEHLRALKPEYQEIIRLRYIEDLSLQEIALVLDKTSVGARVLLHRAMKALRKRVETL